MRPSENADDLVQLVRTIAAEIISSYPHIRTDVLFTACLEAATRLTLAANPGMVASEALGSMIECLAIMKASDETGQVLQYPTKGCPS